jgi:hypothetical protein
MSSVKGNYTHTIFQVSIFRNHRFLGGFYYFCLESIFLPKESPTLSDEVCISSHGIGARTLPTVSVFFS